MGKDRFFANWEEDEEDKWEDVDQPKEEKLTTEERIEKIKDTMIKKKWSTGAYPRGAGFRPILESDILDAQNKSKSGFETARTLGVSYNTYKKWAKTYGIFERALNPSGIGIVRANQVHKGENALDMILRGEGRPDYPIARLKRRLITSGYFAEECTCCGFDEKRATDGKVPLLLDFLDNEWQNHKLENLRFLCYNCFFLLVGKRKIPKRGTIVTQGVTDDGDEDEVTEDELENTEN
jgi:hypothetical protein